MQKVYFLLRNNVHMGPYNLSELEQQSWQPNDLIWIEGESTSWSAPPGIAGPQSQNNKQQNISQKPGAADNGQRKIWVQMPRRESPELERDEVRNHVSAQRNTPAPSPIRESRSPNRQKDRDDVELIIHKKSRHTVSLAQLFAILGITVLTVLAWKSNFTLTPQQENISYAAKPVIFTAAPPPVKVNNVAAPISDDTFGVAKENLVPPSPPMDQKNVTVQKPAKRKKASRALSLPSEGVPSMGTTDATKSSAEVITKEEVPPSEELTPPPAEDASTIKPEKKKTIGQAIRGIFKKKKRNEVKSEEGSAPD
ncbi:MAG TPA: hypothetical protein VEY06_05000 [Flavisolibacter sp.]|jgi:hypothetical protein|nr:hypothetical protein [Flavisolibacter sp.]